LISKWRDILLNKNNHNRALRNRNRSRKVLTSSRRSPKARKRHRSREEDRVDPIIRKERHQERRRKNLLNV
jgi:hypothetical protein